MNRLKVPVLFLAVSSLIIVSILFFGAKFLHSALGAKATPGEEELPKPIPVGGGGTPASPGPISGIYTYPGTGTSTPSFSLCAGNSSLAPGGSNELRRFTTACTSDVGSWFWYGMDPRTVSAEWTGGATYNGPDFRFGMQTSESNSGSGCGKGGDDNPVSPISYTPWASEVAALTANGVSSPEAVGVGNSPDCFRILAETSPQNVTLSNINLSVVYGCVYGSASCAIQLTAQRVTCPSGYVLANGSCVPAVPELDLSKITSLVSQSENDYSPAQDNFGVMNYGGAPLEWHIEKYNQSEMWPSWLYEPTNFSTVGSGTEETPATTNVSLPLDYKKSLINASYSSNPGGTPNKFEFDVVCDSPNCELHSAASGVASAIASDKNLANLLNIFAKPFFGFLNVAGGQTPPSETYSVLYNVPGPTVTLTASTASNPQGGSSLTVSSGEEITLTWSSTNANVASPVAAETGSGFLPANVSSGSFVVPAPAVVGTYSYSITIKGLSDIDSSPANFATSNVITVTVSAAACAAANSCPTGSISVNPSPKCWLADGDDKCRVEVEWNTKNVRGAVVGYSERRGAEQTFTCSSASCSKNLSLSAGAYTFTLYKDSGKSIVLNDGQGHNAVALLDVVPARLRITPSAMTSLAGADTRPFKAEFYDGTSWSDVTNGADWSSDTSKISATSVKGVFHADASIFKTTVANIKATYVFNGNGNIYDATAALTIESTVLSVTNSAPSAAGRADKDVNFYPDETWQLSLASGPSQGGKTVFICGTKNGAAVPGGTICSAAGAIGLSPTTGSDGSWSAAGTFKAADIGEWREWAYVGGTLNSGSSAVGGGVMSNSINFNIVNSVIVIMPGVPELVVSPPFQSGGPGDTLAYVATYYPDSSNLSSHTDVTNSPNAAWTASNSSVASPVARKGSFLISAAASNGMSTVVSVSYRPTAGSAALLASAALNVSVTAVGQHYTCNSNNQCILSATGAFTDSNCGGTCGISPPQHYTCNSNNQCILSATGAFTDSNCGGTCGISPPQHYTCNSNNQCILSVTGAFTDSNCGGTCPPPPTSCVSLAIEPSPASVILGNTVQLKAYCNQADGTRTEITGSAVWSGDIAGIVQLLDKGGYYKGLKLGTAAITMSFGGKTKSVDITVNATPGRQEIIP
jgi:hypothetical protein